MRDTNTIPRFSKDKLLKALALKFCDVDVATIHLRFAEKLSEYLKRPISASQAKAWMDGVRPGSDMLFAIAHVLNQSPDYFKE